RLWLYLGHSIAIIALCMTIVDSLPVIRNTYQGMRQQANGAQTHMSLQVIRDLDAVTRSDQLVITAAPFLVAEADRSTPPQLVDTSFVHIQIGYLSDAQLIKIARQSEVHTVLFYTGRLHEMQVFYLWVSQHFHMVHDYGGGRELWSKIG